MKCHIYIHSFLLFCLAMCVQSKSDVYLRHPYSIEHKLPFLGTAKIIHLSARELNLCDYLKSNNYQQNRCLSQKSFLQLLIYILQCTVI